MFSSLLSQCLRIAADRVCVSTLFHHISSWPLEKVQVLLQAIVQVWQPMQRFGLKTKANCHCGMLLLVGIAHRAAELPVIDLSHGRTLPFGYR